MNTQQKNPPTDLNPVDEAPTSAPGTGEDICPKCNGRGSLHGGQCRNCGGTGKLTRGLGGG